MKGQEQNLLSIIKDMINRMSGSQGSYFMEVTTAHTGLSLDSIVIQEDGTVVTVMSGVDSEGTAVNFKTVQNIPAALQQGALLTVPFGSSITAFTATTGSAIGYTKGE